MSLSDADILRIARALAAELRRGNVAEETWDDDETKATESSGQRGSRRRTAGGSSSSWVSEKVRADLDTFAKELTRSNTRKGSKAK
jgi:hypothetical protein